MSNFIFSLGTINKKLLLPFIYIILYIFINILAGGKNDIVTFYLSSFGQSIGQIMTYFIGRITKYESESSEKNEKLIKHYKRDYFFLFLVCVFYIISYLFYYSIEIVNQDGSYRELFINDALEIIFITIITAIFLRSNYYIHHYISIAIYFLLCILLDIIIGNFGRNNIYAVLISIVYNLADAILYFYLKYMIEHNYYFYMDLLFIFGIFYISTILIALIINIIIQNANGSNSEIFRFYNTYNENGSSYMITIFLMGTFIYGIIISMFEFLIVDKFTSSHVIIGYMIGKIPSTIIEAEDNKRWILSIISIFQIIILLFYLEIFEYNFCSLNRNTKRQISMRQENDLIQRRDSGISFDGYSIPKHLLLLQQKEMDNLEKN